MIKGAIDEALKCKESGEEKVILFNASGHGHFDMGAYDAYFSNQLGEHYFTEDMLKENLKALEGLPKP